MWCDVMAASSGLQRGVGVCVQECGGLRGEGWVQRESGEWGGGHMVGEGRGNVPSGKGGPFSQFVSHSHTHIAPNKVSTLKYKLLFYTFRC